jgi:hypothetical protein
MDINKVCKRFSNVEVLEINNISRACYTRHGQHLNKIGEAYISQEINKIIGKNKKRNHSLRIPKPGKPTTKTGSIRLQLSQSIETNPKGKLKIIHQNVQYLRNKM